MTETELLANPPEAAKAPLTYLRSRDEQVPELRILDATGMVWGCFSPGSHGAFGIWTAVQIGMKRSWFHPDDWEEIK